MMMDMGDPRKIRVANRRRAEFPALILTQLITIPIRNVERRICQDEIKSLIREGIAFECALLVPADIAENPRIARFIRARRNVV